MKKQIAEPDFIGGEGDLTKEEESALAKYFADRKLKTTSKIKIEQTSKKRETATR